MQLQVNCKFFHTNSKSHYKTFICFHIALSENCLKFLVDVFNFDATHRTEVCTSWESNCRFLFTRHNSWRWHDYWCDCIFYNNVRYKSKMKIYSTLFVIIWQILIFFPSKVSSTAHLSPAWQFWNEVYSFCFSNSSMVIRELQFIELFYFQFKLWVISIAKIYALWSVCVCCILIVWLGLFFIKFFKIRFLFAF